MLLYVALNLLIPSKDYLFINDQSRENIFGEILFRDKNERIKFIIPVSYTLLLYFIKCKQVLNIIQINLCLRATTDKKNCAQNSE